MNAVREEKNAGQPIVERLSSMVPVYENALKRGTIGDNCSTMAPVFRIGYAVLLLINIGVWWPKATRWFTDEGVLTAATAERITGHRHWSLLFELPSTPGVVGACLAVMTIQAVCLLLGFFSRFQAACLFLWLVSFQHRNPLICDGEDTVFRLFAFFMIFMPLDARWALRTTAKSKAALQSIEKFEWGLALVRIEMTLIYLSAGISKLYGQTWRDGSALFYVFRMDDHMGRSFLPEWLFDQAWFVRSATWGSLAIELLLPFALWLPPTRRWAVVVGVLFHLAIEATLNLFLFEWIMILGLLAFVQPAAQLSATKTIIDR